MKSHLCLLLWPAQGEAVRGSVEIQSGSEGGERTVRVGAIYREGTLLHSIEMIFEVKSYIVSNAN